MMLACPRRRSAVNQTVMTTTMVPVDRSCPSGLRTVTVCNPLRLLADSAHCFGGLFPRQTDWFRDAVRQRDGGCGVSVALSAAMFLSQRATQIGSMS